MASRARELLPLLRPALAPTAAADVVVAAALFTDADLSRVAAAAAGSICLYCGGMAQNDLCDRARDAKLHPGRPLARDPSLAPPARLLVAGLFAAGLTLAALGGALLPAVAVLLLASAYNLGAKARFPWDGLCLGAARAANLAIGFSAGEAPWSVETFTCAAAYLLYAGGVTGASRAEDLDPAPTRRLTLLLAFVPQAVGLAGFASIAVAGRSYALLLPLALLLLALRRAIARGTREAAVRYVRDALLVIFPLHAAVLWARQEPGPIASIAVCAGASFLLLAAVPRSAG
ncbi:MAG: UbiA family prenyltransferase [Planctomycetota bacterium]